MILQNELLLKEYLRLSNEVRSDFTYDEITLKTLRDLEKQLIKRGLI
ncbi:MAG: hypothetical protein GTO02_07860 [Candidatus Dadabacteria bacterium]|nr:hypothetical protein [Candidatus Dadabacteria bacterium]